MLVDDESIRFVSHCVCSRSTDGGRCIDDRLESKAVILHISCSYLMNACH